jgi:TetR/AcrR family transcriptional regulator
VTSAPPASVVPASVPVVPARKERGGEVTKERILKAAEGEFAAKGFDGARLAAIARTADVPQALIHHYFADKAGLYRAVLERVLASIAAEGWRILETMAPPRARPDGARFGRTELRALVDAFVAMLVEFYTSQGHVLRILRDEAVHGGTLGDELVRSLLKPQFDEVVARFDAMKAAGEVRADVDARHLCISTIAMACFPMMDEAFLGALWEIDPRTHEFVEARKAEIVRTVMARIAP